MSREIKFRVWDKEDKKMKYDAQDTYDYMRNNIMEDCFGDVLNNENYEVMQYTGLKDKNFKEIYEGDIMKVKPPIWAKEGIFKVIYDNGRFIITDNKVWQNIGTLVEYSEVIGNIYENLELLEVNENEN